MRRFRLASPALALLGLVLGAGLARADAAAPGIGIAVEDFSYTNTSGEPTDQSAAHRERLQALMAALRQDLAADGQYRLVPLSCGEPCTGNEPAADLLRAASDAGARILIFGGIHKQSTLVQWAKVVAIDIAGNRVLLDRLFTFRGDSDEAWQRAEAFMSREIRAALATH
jgi:Protein of unknown function (DUF2380)